MPTSLTSTYLIPAVLLNPVVILHGVNTFCSHIIPTTIAASTSQHQWLENLGPPATAEPYFNIHSNDQFCWGYTILMVVVQVLAFGRVGDNRVQRKSTRTAAKAERERKIALQDEKMASESLTAVAMNGHGSGLDLAYETPKNGITNRVMSGQLSPTHSDGEIQNSRPQIQEIAETTAETSSEETVI